MEEQLTLSNRDIDKLKVISNVINGHLTWNQAGEQLQLCRRQIGYLCAQVRKDGHRGILHGLRGKPSHHQLSKGLLDRALTLLKKPRYAGFGPTFAQEKLEDLHGIVLSPSTLRQGMIHAGLWSPRKHGPTHRAWRERRSCVGALVQLDGSDHDWFEGRGPRCVLIVYIDDATSRILYAQFVNVEDTLTLLATTRTYIQRHGRPIAYYVDKDSIYKINRKASIDEELKDSEPITQFTRAMTELGIEVICANSPQAKGRVERSFGTHQDRLVKELRLAGISNQKDANHFLETIYIPAHNAKFAVPPANTTDAHRPILKTQILDHTLSIRAPRVLANDYTLTYQKRFYQLLPDQPVRLRPKQIILVETRLDGSTHLRLGDTYLHFKIILRKSAPTTLQPQTPQQVTSPAVPYRPAANHPWRAAWRPRLASRVLAHV
jgi:hypothetical protein